MKKKKKKMPPPPDVPPPERILSAEARAGRHLGYFRCVQGAIVRAGPEMHTEQVGVVYIGEEVLGLECITNPDGLQRLRCEGGEGALGGWVR